LFLCTTNQTILQPEDPENPYAMWVELSQATNYLKHQKDIEFYSSVLPQIKESLAS